MLSVSIIPIVGILATLSLAVVVWYVWRHYNIGRHFVWRPADIQVEVEAANPALGNLRHLHLRQTLRPQEAGWKGMRIAIPDSWRITEVSVGARGVLVLLESGERYHVHRGNVGKLTNALDGDYRGSVEIGSIWEAHART